METLREYFQEYRHIPHYHGDIVRNLFITNGLIMLVALPFFRDIIPVPIYGSIFTILAIVLLAGLTNPKISFIVIIDAVASISGFLVFEYLSIDHLDTHLNFALVNQLLALIFFAAVYYSTKTLRGYFLRDQSDE